MNTLIMGRRGTGKTTLAVWKARQLNIRAIAWSPNAEYENSDLRTTDLDTLIDYIDTREDDEGYFVEYIAEPPYDDNFNEFGRRLWSFNDFVLIVDEASEIQSPMWMNDQLNRYIRRAPRREKGEAGPIDIVQTTHFPVDLHKVSFGLGDDAYIFNLTQRLHVDRIERELGAEVAAAVRSARTPESSSPGRDVVHINLITQKFEVMEDPEEWYVNLNPEEPQEIE